jgi:3',5'-cyclic AMP phosphodiesterase CpdA
VRTIVHLSDLHFGRIDEAILAPLARVVTEAQPHVVVVSGDLTQRARGREFRAAREWLDQLPRPQVVVPGNHDVPLHNVLLRIVDPLDKYRRYVNEDLEPAYVDDEIAVVGVNTARSLTVKSGRINREQVARLCSRLGPPGDARVRVIVSHHPFDVAEQGARAELVGRARMARAGLVGCGADLLLAGHFHVGGAGHTAVRQDEAGRSVVVVQAGTATSTRGRGQSNSFNVLRVADPEVTVERLDWSAEKGAFETAAVERFRRASHGWWREATSTPS